MKKWLLIIGLLIILIIIVIFIFIKKPNKYVKNYFEVIGLTEDHFYSTVKKIYGEPLDIVYLEDNNNYFTAKYNGIEFFCFALQDGDATIRSVHIYNSEFRFGKKKIGVGSTKKEIENVYNKFEKIGDTLAYGFIDGFTWLEFYFDGNEKVNKIIMYENGP